MKKGMGLIEVIISIVLISVVVLAVIKTQKNNLHQLDNFQRTLQYQSFISLAKQENAEDDKTLHLDELIPFKDDRLREYYKDVKVEVSKEKESTEKISHNNINVSIDIIKTSYTIEDKTKQDFYRFEIK